MVAVVEADAVAWVAVVEVWAAADVVAWAVVLV
jgi:hypothetical protein